MVPDVWTKKRKFLLRVFDAGIWEVSLKTFQTHTYLIQWVNRNRWTNLAGELKER